MTPIELLREYVAADEAQHTAFHKLNARRIAEGKSITSPKVEGWPEYIEWQAASQRMRDALAAARRMVESEV